jgi:hypothetical protein
VNLANGGLKSFGSLVIQGFGYVGLEALLIQMLSGAVQLDFIIVSAIICSVVSNVLTIVMLCHQCPGMVLMYTLDDSYRSGQLAIFQREKYPKLPTKVRDSLTDLCLGVL